MYVKNRAEMRLRRWAYTKFGTFGTLRVDLNGRQVFMCFTVERHWRDNARHISCIPKGAYAAFRSTYHRGGYETWELQGVPNRSEIKIHIGNTYRDVNGCIALGQSLGWVSNRWAVTRSRHAFDNFTKALREATSAVIIVEDSQNPDGTDDSASDSAQGVEGSIKPGEVT